MNKKKKKKKKKVIYTEIRINTSR